MQKTIFISLFKLNKHDFYRTIRFIQKAGDPWATIYLTLHERIKEETANMLKLVSSLIAVYLLLSTFGSPEATSITIGEIQASVPTVFVTLIATFTIFFLMLNFLQWLILVTFRGEFGVKLRGHGFTATHFSYYRSGGEISIALPIVTSIFFVPRLPLPRFLELFVLISIFAMFIPLLAFGVFLWSMNVEIIEKFGILSVFGCTGVFANAVLVVSLIYFVGYFVPIPFKKNVSGLRWNFLFNVYTPGNEGKIDRWLKETED